MEKWVNRGGTLETELRVLVSVWGAGRIRVLIFYFLFIGFLFLLN